ncbi:MAG: molybdopterin-dependent oxidoreductase, partial [bacterium]|nr:molybdopterin-dependent oxidoreductase [bacterium]
LCMDPVELRRRNLLRAGDATITGQVLTESVGAEETLTRALEVAQRQPVRGTEQTTTGRVARGRGISTIMYGVGLGAGGTRLARTGAEICINEDGSVTFAVGTTEIGQGMCTVLGQIVAEALGITAEEVTMLPTDTSRVPDSGPTVASRSTTMSGAALLNAAETLRARLLAVAGEILRCDPASLCLRDGQVWRDGTPTGLSFRDVVRECGERRIGLAACGWHHPRELAFDWTTCQGDAYVVFAFATNIADVEVDCLTGQVRVLRVIAAHDVGKAINPALVEGQIEGGVVQGIGYALYEEVVREGGEIKNPHFSTYIIPTAADVPEIVPVVVEVPYSGGPYGAKGFGEQPLMGVAPAIANAVCNALGITVTKLPLTPEYLWQLVRARGKVQGSTVV